MRTPVNQPEPLKVSGARFLGARRGKISADGISAEFTFYSEGQFVAPHCHEIPTLFFVVTGTLIENIASDMVISQSGSIGFHPAAWPHHNYFGNGGTCVLNIPIESRCSGEWIDELKQLDRPVFVPARNDSVSLDELGVPETRSSARAGPRPGRPSLVDAIDRLIARIRSENRRRKTCASSAKAVVDSGYLDLETGPGNIAESLNVHPSNLSRSFRSAYGCTLTTYLQLRRLDHSCRLLIHSCRSINQIAAESCFADQAHLTRVMSGLFGITPGRFRKQYRR